ncbi:MAG: hypothetical protein ABIK28_24505 [Planctomycetota bacterium]
MRIICPYYLLCLLLAAGFFSDQAVAVSTQGAAVPVFQPDFTTTWNGGTIHTDNSGIVPNAVDWNGDGAKDLLVGVFYNGNIFFYPNHGTNENPVFQDRSMLQADGSNIALSYG